MMDKAKLIQKLKSAITILEKDESILTESHLEVEASSVDIDGMQHFGVKLDFKLSRQLDPLYIDYRSLDDK